MKPVFAIAKGKIETNAIISTLLIFLFSVAMTMAAFALQPNAIGEVMACIAKNPLIFVFNFMPVLLLSGFFYYIFNNIFYAATVVYFLVGIASLINKYKIVYRDDPFVPADIFLGAEAFSVVTKMKIPVDPLLIIGGILPAIVLIALGIFIKSSKMHMTWRIMVPLSCILIAIGLNNFIYKPAAIHDKLTTDRKTFNVTENFNKKGFIYCFLYNLNTYTIDRPGDYDRQYAEGFEEKYALPGGAHKPAVKPHVIFILNEAFTDIGLNPNLIFDNKDDPLLNYKRIAAEGLNGFLVVPNYGGGTANTEYDILTGCMTIDLSKTSTSAFRLVRKDFDALPRFFITEGYDTMFMHPGESWFYNRQNVYRYFGIDSQIFGDQFGDPADYKGGLVSDEAVTGRLISGFQTRSDSGNRTPLFDFIVTIQNHMPYTHGKYGPEKVDPVKTRIGISDSASEYLSNYFVGLRDADRSLDNLTDFCTQKEEPVVLVFFGDHLPNLGPGYLTYKEIGYDINENGSVGQIINCYKVPFIIWANESARKAIDFDDAIERLDLMPDRTISANYLGAMLYEILGYKGIEPFYDFLNELRRDLPVITRDYYKTVGGYSADLPEELEERVSDYRIWQYYKMTDEVIDDSNE